MSGLFKGNKLLQWEVDLLVNVIERLPPAYHYLAEQIKHGLFNRRSVGNRDIPGYVSLGFTPGIIGKFENLNKRGFHIKGVKIYDIKSKSYLDYIIYTGANTVIGYAIQGAEKFEIHINRIDISGFKIKYRENPDFSKLATVLNPTELALINPDEIYPIKLKGKTYYHFRDLEDGDFLGVDLDKNIFEITHDPFAIKPVSFTLEQVLTALEWKE